MKIHAWAATKAGDDLSLQDFEVAVKETEVVVDVTSCSLTRGGVRFIDNYWGESTYPLVDDYEIIGKVREDFSNDRHTFKAGDVVGLGYQVGACFACEYCKAGKEQYCLQQKLIPFDTMGGLADVVVVDKRFVFPMPKNLQHPGATPLMCAGLTVFTPIQKANLKPKSTVGVVGLGSLGHLAVKFLSAMGHEVTAFTRTASKAEKARAFGVTKVVLDDETIDPREFDFIIVTASDGVDWERYIRALKPEGTLCIVGLPSKPVVFMPELLADLAARRIVGNYSGSRQDMEDMLQFADAHHILAEATLYPMNEVNRALSDMRVNKVDFSAVIVAN